MNDECYQYLFSDFIHIPILIRNFIRNANHANQMGNFINKEKSNWNLIIWCFRSEKKRDFQFEIDSNDEKKKNYTDLELSGGLKI